MPSYMFSIYKVQKNRVMVIADSVEEAATQAAQLEPQLASIIIDEFVDEFTLEQTDDATVDIDNWNEENAHDFVET